MRRASASLSLALTLLGSPWAHAIRPGIEHPWDLPGKPRDQNKAIINDFVDYDPSRPQRTTRPAPAPATPPPAQPAPAGSASSSGDQSTGMGYAWPEVSRPAATPTSAEHPVAAARSDATDTALNQLRGAASGHELLHGRRPKPTGDLSGPSSRVNSGRFATELGTPLYVIEQPSTAAAGGSPLYLWEIRPTERQEQRMHSGSRLLYQGRGQRAAAFALAGFEMDDAGVRPGVALFLTPKGRLHRAQLTVDAKNGWGSPEILPGEYTVLERGAEETLFAVTAEQSVVEVGATGAPLPQWTAQGLGLRAGERIISVARPLEGQRKASEVRTVYLLTSEGRVINNWGSYEVTLPGAPPRNADAPQMLVHGDGLWVTHGGELLRIDIVSGAVTNRTSLHEVFTEAHAQDGGKVEFLGMTDGMLYSRLGARAYRFSVPSAGNGLSYRIVDSEFFSRSLARFGVQTGLYSSTSVMQPRTADRNGRRWSDLKTAANPDLSDVRDSAAETRDEMTPSLRSRVEIMPHQLKLAEALGLDVPYITDDIREILSKARNNVYDSAEHRVIQENKMIAELDELDGHLRKLINRQRHADAKAAPDRCVQSLTRQRPSDH